jgi:hypothetical protein
LLAIAYVLDGEPDLGPGSGGLKQLGVIRVIVDVQNRRNGSVAPQNFNGLFFCRGFVPELLHVTSTPFGVRSFPVDPGWTRSWTYPNNWFSDLSQKKVSTVLVRHLDRAVVVKESWTLPWAVLKP